MAKSKELQDLYDRVKSGETSTADYAKELGEINRRLKAEGKHDTSYSDAKVKYDATGNEITDKGIADKLYEKQQADIEYEKQIRQRENKRRLEAGLSALEGERPGIEEGYKQNVEDINRDVYRATEGDKITAQQRGTSVSNQYEAVRQGTVREGMNIRQKAYDQRTSKLSDLDRRISALRQDVALTEQGIEVDAESALRQAKTTAEYEQLKYELGQQDKEDTREFQREQMERGAEITKENISFQFSEQLKNQPLIDEQKLAYQEKFNELDFAQQEKIFGMQEASQIKFFNMESARQQYMAGLNLKNQEYLIDKQDRLNKEQFEYEVSVAKEAEADAFKMDVLKRDPKVQAFMSRDPESLEIALNGESGDQVIKDVRAIFDISGVDLASQNNLFRDMYDVAFETGAYDITEADINAELEKIMSRNTILGVKDEAEERRKLKEFYGGGGARSDYSMRFEALLNIQNARAENMYRKSQGIK